MRALLTQADTGINHAVENIHHKHNADIHRAVNEAKHNNHIVIVGLDCCNQQTANAGNREDFLHHKAAGHQPHDQRRKHRYNRDQRIAQHMNVADNLMLRDFRRKPFSRLRVLNHRAVQKYAAQKMAEYQIRASGTTGPMTPARLLSGGNQQKLIIARELADQARLIVASQPTRGLDIGATEFVRKMLVEQRDAGKSVLLISADLEEILALSDRIAVMFAGRIVGVLPREQATVQQLGLLMGGITDKEGSL